MLIYGFQGTSLLDFPGRVASLVFTGGCNLACAFCHNPGLVRDPEQYPVLSETELFADLNRRRAFIDGVVVSGGEPTLATDLEDFLGRIKGLGLQIKLDSNGLRPLVLARLLDKGLIDYLAIDLKTAPSRYAELSSGPVDSNLLVESCRLAIECAPEYEFRTTCVPGLVTTNELNEMGEVIRGASRWVLQQYIPREELLGDAPSEPYAASEFERLSTLAKPYVTRVDGRGW
ncbi:MAG: anaerobic ribonucleoside-triphosphate reductase activating protein [Geopsychrobacter sp.]|nr:anaerobic ribonucleoside-triphosphate reductase activating protein [Geopsychrobacter sp.]